MYRQSPAPDNKFCKFTDKAVLRSVVARCHTGIWGLSGFTYPDNTKITIKVGYIHIFYYHIEGCDLKKNGKTKYHSHIDPKGIFGIGYFY